MQENLASLLSLSQEPIDLERRDQNGRTALLYFVENTKPAGDPAYAPLEYISSIRCLKALGADFQAKTPEGYTALHIWASRYLSVSGDKFLQNLRSTRVEKLKSLINCGVPIDAVDRTGRTAIELSCKVHFDGITKVDRLLRPRIWREVLESTGHDPAQFQVLVDAFPDLQRNVDTQAPHTKGDELEASGSTSHYGPATPDSSNQFLSDEYDSGSTDTEDNASDQSSEASLDHDPSSPAAQARTSEPPSPSPSVRFRAPAGTFWDVIDYAVEQQEGNSWES